MEKQLKKMLLGIALLIPWVSLAHDCSLSYDLSKVDHSKVIDISHEANYLNLKIVDTWGSNTESENEEKDTYSRLQNNSSIDSQDCDTIHLPYTANFSQCWTANDGATIIGNNRASLTSQGQSITSPWIEIPSNTIGYCTYTIVRDTTGASWHSQDSSVGIILTVEDENGVISTHSTTSSDSRMGWYVSFPATTGYLKLTITYTGSHAVRLLYIEDFIIYACNMTLSVEGPTSVHVGDTSVYLAHVAGEHPDHWYWTLYDQSYSSVNGSDASIISSTDSTRTIVWHSPGNYRLYTGIQKYFPQLNSDAWQDYFHYITVYDTNCNSISLPYTADFSQCWSAENGATIVDFNHVSIASSGQKIVSPWLDSDSIKTFLRWKTTNSDWFNVIIKIENEDNVIKSWTYTNYNGSHELDFLSPGGRIRVSFEYANGGSDSMPIIYDLRLFQYPIELSIDAPGIARVGDTVTIHSITSVAPGDSEPYAFMDVSDEYYRHVGFTLVSSSGDNIRVIFNAPGRYRVSADTYIYTPDGDYATAWVEEMINIVNYPFYTEDSIYYTSATKDSVIGCHLHLRSARLSDSANVIVDSAFCNHSNLTSVLFPESLTHIGNSAFEYDLGLTEITIPRGVKHIGDYAFYGNSNLTVVNFNADSCLIMGPFTSSSGSYRPVFYGCDNLTTVNIGENVKRIPDRAFSHCSKVRGTLVIPDSVTYIGYAAFFHPNWASESDTLQVVLSRSVTEIGNHAFRCPSGQITTIISRAAVPPVIQNSSFFNYYSYPINPPPLIVPCGTMQDYRTAQYWNLFSEITEDCSGLLPDLQVTWVTVPDTIVPQMPTTLQWMLYNSGDIALENRNVSVGIMYNETEIYNYTQAVTLNAGDSLLRQVTITLPCTNDTTGSFSIATDIFDSILERDETNNMAYSQSFTIDSPRLYAVSGMVPAPDSVISHGSIVLRWDTVTNATNYCVYVWPNGQLMPSTPSYTTNLPNIIISSYENNQVYSWKVDAVNQCDTVSGTIQHFAIFKQPALTLNKHSLSFGEVEYNTSARESLHISGKELTDSIILSLHGTDSAMFSISSRTLSRHGGSVEITFTPTIMKRSFDAVVAVQSGSLRDSILLNGMLANFYIFTVNVSDSILPPASPIPITGTLTNAANVPQANVPVDIWVSVMGRTIVVTDTTDSQGHFSYTYTPVISECGDYEVGACPQGSSNRNVLTSFNIPGISINETALPIWEVVQYDTVRGSIPIKNRCGVTLHNVSVGTISLPTGLLVEFDTLTLAPFQEDSLHYTIIGTVQSTGTRYERVGLSCNSMEGNLARINLNYYCHKPIPNLQISFDSLFCSVVPGTQKIVDAILYNNTDSIFSNVQIQTPSRQSVVSLLQPDTTYSIAPHDSLFVHLLVSVPEDASWGIATGDLWVTADNTQPQFIPYTISPASDETGNLMVLVSNEYTYYNNGPHVSGATVAVIGYYTLDTVAVAQTGSDGMVAIDSLPEGYYKVYVSAPENTSYSKITRITAGETTYLDIDLEYQAITYKWVAYQVGEEDEYEIVLNTEFKTNVPKPVITIDIPVVDVPLDGSMGTFNFVVSNHGLIDSYNATIEMPQSSRYEFFPLFDKVDTLHALSSIVVPCGIRDRAVYDSIEKIKNRGNYYIDTVWSVSSYQQIRTSYSDSTILVPTSRYIDDSTREETWIYDTIIVSIPHYIAESILDSSINHIIFRDISTNEVLMDINMNPQEEGDAKKKVHHKNA